MFLQDFASVFAMLYAPNDHQDLFISRSLDKLLDCDPGIILEDHKAVIWGLLIKHGSRFKQDREDKLVSLLIEIHNLQFQHKHAPSQTLEWGLLTLCRQITDLMRYKAKSALKVCRKQYLDSAIKCVQIPQETNPGNV